MDAVLCGCTDVDDVAASAGAGAVSSVAGLAFLFGLGRVDTFAEGVAGFDPVVFCAIADAKGSFDGMGFEAGFGTMTAEAGTADVDCRADVEPVPDGVGRPVPEKRKHGM